MQWQARYPCGHGRPLNNILWPPRARTATGLRAGASVGCASSNGMVRKCNGQRGTRVAMGVL